MLATPEENNLYKDLGLRLRKARIRRKITQADLGARTGISRQLIIKMEKGDPTVSLARWVKVSTALDLLDSWENVLMLPVDPFAEFDRQRQELDQLKKTRVRNK
jgi:transcriptional regulator with XRE-family HTH domain